jgi:hypothetical protein
MVIAIGPSAKIYSDEIINHANRTIPGSFTTFLLIIL